MDLFKCLVILIRVNPHVRIGLQLASINIIIQRKYSTKRSSVEIANNSKLTKKVKSFYAKQS